MATQKPAEDWDAKSKEVRKDQKEGSVPSWLSCVPDKKQEDEGVMPLGEVDKIWEKIFTVAGAKTPEQRRSVKLATWMYAYKNGTSRVGAYRRNVHAKGLTFNSSYIPKFTGKFDIRRFFAGTRDECYTGMVESGYAGTDEDYVTEVEAAGVPRAFVHATGDFMRDCAKLTAAEKTYAEQMFSYRIEKARRARGGKSLEEVEGAVNDATLKAQGPSVDVTPTVSGQAW